MYFIEKELNGLPCKVYFFKSWGTYEHPVKPKDPISYAEALQRKGYCRAWMCEQNGAEQFILFEGVRLEKHATTAAKPNKDSQELEFFRDEGGEVPQALTLSDSLGFQPLLVSMPDTSEHLISLTPNLGYSYRYTYKPEGALEKAEITNMEGKVTIIEY